MKIIYNLHMDKIKKPRLYCFSPAVMLATLTIEIILAIYTFWKYKLNAVTKIVIMLLICLALFQWAEYNVCEGAILLDNLGWAKLGYIAITMLPPLGIHLIYEISGDKRRWIPVLGYTFAAMFISYFLLEANGIKSGACLGNYVIFENQPGVGMWYGLYYYGLLFAAIAYAYVRSKTSSKHIRRSLGSLIVGYVLFMAPTTFVNIIDPSTIIGIPSIMCGFAVLMAVVLAGEVLPEYVNEK